MSTWILIFNSICYLLFFAIIYEIHKKPLSIFSKCVLLSQRERQSVKESFDERQIEPREEERLSPESIDRLNNG